MTRFETNHENPADSTLQATRWEVDKGWSLQTRRKTVGVNRRKPARSLGEGQEGGTLKRMWLEKKWNKKERKNR